MVFSTDESDTDYRIHTVIMPYLNISLPNIEVKSFSIKNFKGSSDRGEVELIAPTELSTQLGDSSFLFTDLNSDIKIGDISGIGNSIEFSVVDNVTQYNQVLRSGYIMPKFNIIIKDMGSVNYRSIMDSQKEFNSSMLMQYLGVTDNVMSFQFDIEIEFVDESEYRKRFRGSISEQSLFDTGSSQSSLEIVE